jgi:hypothetical protein
MAELQFPNAQYGSNFAYGASAYKDDGPLAQTTTVMDIIRRSLRLFGGIQPGEVPTAQQTSDCLQQLNWMIDDWNNEKNIQPYVNTTLFPMIAGQQTYYIGQDPTADFVTERPLKIENAFTRWLANPAYPVDYQLTLISTVEFEQLVLKNLTSSWPLYLNYTLMDMPVGRLRIYPIPTASALLSLSYWQPIKSYTSAQDTVSMPPGYLDAFALNLAVAMAPEWGVDATPRIQRMALVAKQRLSITNGEPVRLSKPVKGTAGRIYNIFADRYLN